MKETQSFSFDPELERLLQQRIDGLRLVDDIFFKACLKDNPKAAEAIIRVALDMPEAEVESVHIQDGSAFLPSRNVGFDLKVRDKDGRLFDVEVQKGHLGELPRRSRYYMGALTVESLRRGQGFPALPDAYVLFLCETDPIGDGEPVYDFVRTDRRNAKRRVLEDGSHVVFFNCAYKGDDAYGRLAFDMLSADSAKIGDPVLRDTVHRGKIGERRTDVMSDLAKEIMELGEKRGLEKGRKEGAEQSKREIALALLKRGIDPEQVSEDTGLPLETVLSLKK
ncbi:MAG: PD-(D/E)XK nuclease family transposase [Bacilli bacterium]|nr:PD-(D/E)XK nuclease family transposase [Bacilli bacterium]